MELSQNTKTILVVVACVIGIAALYYSITRAMNTDVDPYARVDIPGYYNGPMKPKGKPDMPAAGGIPGETKPVGFK